MAFYMNMMALNEARTKGEYERKRYEEDLKREIEYGKKAMRRNMAGLGKDQSENTQQFSKTSEENYDRWNKAASMTDKAMNYPAKGSPEDYSIARAAVDKHLRKQEKKTKHESGIFSECYFLDEE